MPDEIKTLDILLEEIVDVTLPEDMKGYVDLVETLASDKSDFPFPNSSHVHAAIVMTTMLRHSEGDFCIYDNDLSADIAREYPKFYRAMADHVRGGRGLKIVVDTITNQDKTMVDILSSLVKTYPEQVKVSVASDPFKNAVLQIYKRKLNFAVGDGKSYRLEELKEETPQNKRKAFCCFNDPSMALLLKSAFDAEFHSCDPVI